MDLMHAYCRDVLGIADLSVLAQPTAAQVYSNFANVKGHELFTKIDNTPTGVPQKGDIIFWNTGIGSAGHVAVFRDGDVNTFNSFDQNFPVGSLPHIQNHNYNSVAGWLRFKGDLQTLLNQAIADRDKNWNLYQADEAKITDLNNQIKALQDRITKIKTFVNGA